MLRGRSLFTSLVGHDRRAALLLVVYGVVIGVSFLLAYQLRFDFNIPVSNRQEPIRLLPLVLGIKLLALVLFRQLNTMLRYFSIPDLARLVWAMGLSSLLLLLPRWLGWPDYTVPRGVLLVDFIVCLGMLCALRVLVRILRERLRPVDRPTAAGSDQRQQRVAIIGAGDAGAALAKELISNPRRGLLPVMFFDDDLGKRGKLVHGVAVMGRAELLAEVRDIGTITQAVIAMPSASAKRTREIVALFTGQGIKVETLPSLVELASGQVRATKIRPVEVQDLLGREAVNLDTAGILQAIENKVVLVTGAGGSIGSELCRQIAALNPKRLLLVDQAEPAMFQIEQEMNELGLGSVVVPIVADITDHDRMESIFLRYRPAVVFHAAAHKHVYLMERQPAEAIRNNVFGTRQLAQIAIRFGVESFTFVSTDKAINPTNVMGATKRLAEIQLMALSAAQADTPVAGERVRANLSAAPERRTIGFPVAAAAFGAEPWALAGGGGDAGLKVGVELEAAEGKGPLGASVKGPRTKFMAVRFGNVLGSSGSVIPIFKRQIANGGPITVTHPNVTRYFMTIPEAVGLVLQSFRQGKGGEIFVLDMGQPVKIVDLAKQMIELAGLRPGEDIEIKITGLKPGEKLFEELQHRTERYSPTEHPRIMQFTSPATSSESGLEDLEENLHRYDANELKAALKRIVSEYEPHWE